MWSRGGSRAAAARGMGAVVRMPHRPLGTLTVRGCAPTRRRTATWVGGEVRRDRAGESGHVGGGATRQGPTGAAYHVAAWRGGATRWGGGRAHCGGRCWGRSHMGRGCTQLPTLGARWGGRQCRSGAPHGHVYRAPWGGACHGWRRGVVGAIGVCRTSAVQGPTDGRRSCSPQARCACSSRGARRGPRYRLGGGRQLIGI